MVDNKYNANKIIDLLKQMQGPGSPFSQPGLDQIFPLGVPTNQTAPNRASGNRTLQSSTPVNRPNQSSNRQVQNTLNPNRPRRKPNKTLENIHNSKSNAAPSAARKNENNINTKSTNDTKNPKYQEEANVASQTNILNDLLNFSNMNSEDILKGFIFSEIIGKPKALRRGRW
ncbi:MAG TPA: hypothetical protein PK604_05300 [Acetivibrio clariflavus]|nr:hypothetical protein [Acetivibrio clariflavus]HPU40961.1 hypothetical protein [Acetivibrio clariflavus]